jgi:hypothetical protein
MIVVYVEHCNFSEEQQCSLSVTTSSSFDTCTSLTLIATQVATSPYDSETRWCSFWLTTRSVQQAWTVLSLGTEHTLDATPEGERKAFVLALGPPSCTGAVGVGVKGDSAVVVAGILGLFAGIELIASSSSKVAGLRAVALGNDPG